MFCSNCGRKIVAKTDKKSVKHTDSIDTHSTEASESHSNKSTTKLQRRYKDTANSSIALSMLGLIATFFVILSEQAATDALIGTVIVSPFFLPYYYFGQRLKRSGTSNLVLSLKISKWMLIYTALFVTINIIAGGISILWVILLYYFYKSYKDTKDYIDTTK